ncbi:hypothetical protein [Streptomyces sp. NPDC046685]|uniref:hypothetical protein n=1 Tax=Streptomyces sp. NPDC046685 TaxID=3157202 RepID=UPI0033FB47A6
MRRRTPWISYLAALRFIGWLHELTLIQFALYSVGRYRGRRAAVLATLAYVAFALLLFYGVPQWPAARAETLSGFLGLFVPIGVLAAAMGIAAYRHDLVGELTDRRAEAAVLRAVEQERTSVARDVHDFVGRERGRAGGPGGGERAGRFARTLRQAAVYRVVQECLTNGQARAGPDRRRVDRGAGPAAPRPPPEAPKRPGRKSCGSPSVDWPCE